MLNSLQLLAHTTGAGIAIGTGTNVDIGGVTIGSVATTVTIKSGTSTLMELTASQDFACPVNVTGVITATSSGGSFTVRYRSR